MEKSVAKKNESFVLGAKPLFWGKSSTIISQKKNTYWNQKYHKSKEIFSKLHEKIFRKEKKKLKPEPKVLSKIKN
jgi:hypothetical protein